MQRQLTMVKKQLPPPARGLNSDPFYDEIKSCTSYLELEAAVATHGPHTVLSAQDYAAYEYTGSYSITNLSSLSASKHHDCSSSMNSTSRSSFHSSQGYEPVRMQSISTPQCHGQKRAPYENRESFFPSQPSQLCVNLALSTLSPSPTGRPKCPKCPSYEADTGFCSRENLHCEELSVKSLSMFEDDTLYDDTELPKGALANSIRLEPLQ